MAIPTDTLYVPASAAEIRDDFLTDVRLEARKYADEDQVDRITRPGTDWYILATAVGNLGLLQYSNIARADANANILTATGDSLDAFREALGLPPVNASPATGRIVITTQPTAAVANFNNDQLVLPNGKRAKVDGVHVGIANQGEVPVITIDVGADCNLAAGNVVRFVSPPLNCKTEAKVSVNAPLTGAVDTETDERKRDRILNRLRNIPAGGNWGYAIEQAMSALATVQYAFVYPALGGPGSSKVTLVKDFDYDNFDFTRTLSSQATSIVRDALHATMPDEMEIVVSSVFAQSANAAIAVSLPSAASAGGNGKGWIDPVPWPPLEFGATHYEITAISSDGTQITVDATTAVSPVAGQTHISWWSAVDCKFSTRLVTAVAGGFGAWVLTLDNGLFDHNNTTAQVNEYISPAAVNIAEYGKTWMNSLRKLGPGENTGDAARLPRALRRPFISEGAWVSDLTIQQLLDMKNAHAEITDAAWSYQSATTPGLPGNVASDPLIFVPNHFGVYKL